MPNIAKPDTKQYEKLTNYIVENLKNTRTTIFLEEDMSMLFTGILKDFINSLKEAQ